MPGPTSRLRVILFGDDRVLAATLEADVDLVTQDAQAVVSPLPGQLDHKTISRTMEARRMVNVPTVAIVDDHLSPREVRALAASAEGIVEREALDRSLIPTLHAVVAGQAVVPAWMHRALQRPPLSNREKQIMAMVVLGFSNAEIATRLVVTESTVKNHLSSAFAKMGVRSRAAATSLILDPATGLGLGVLQLSPPRVG